ncbi:FAD binding domain-containing protein [Nonomuraea basaltis]|uniref:FAD binding domain-containing protein n=1 Tax=Nonomuraea basaltis TaxID=2495887 RepID=UPI00110C555E|nr:xanthine dehydrogenase family protein subunit M [Nonomuraea basaltis]TMR97155.1 xanthine dehydrogenase family protein subunit M [Nonomuraea basaltis]
MRPFSYTSATSTAEAIGLAASEQVRFLAGGTNLVDLMRAGIEEPEHVVDITRLPLDGVEELPDGGLRIGALARNTRVAGDARVRRRYPMLAQAIMNGASPQLRNRATVGGNILQRTRCGYFYDRAAACNKRVPGAGCDALEGFNRMHAVLGASDSCIAVHPSDMCVALAALDATVNIAGRDAAVPLTDFHRLPGDSPHVETVLAPGELITSIDLPAARPGRSVYLKVRDRATYAFALVSTAVQVHVENGRVAGARIALGGVAHKPWRAHEAEELLRGEAVDDDLLRRAAERSVAGARPRAHNAFKPELATRLVRRALEETTS